MIESGECTDVGAVRTQNEDSLRIAKPAPSTHLIMVADGMGGHAKGEVASAMAVELLADSLAARAGEGGFDPIPALREGFREANEAIYARGQAEEDARGMGTTLTAGVVRDKRLYICHAGDSRAYLIRGDTIRQLTRDHTRVQDMLDDGAITAQEAATSDCRHLLTRVVGTFQSVECDTAEYELDDGDFVLLCTDGLHGSVSAQDMAATARTASDPGSLCRKLVALARARDGSDNITAVAVRVNGGRGGSTRQLVLALLLALVLAAGGFLVKSVMHR